MKTDGQELNSTLDNQREETKQCDTLKKKKCVTFNEEPEIFLIPANNRKSRLLAEAIKSAMMNSNFTPRSEVSKRHYKELAGENFKEITYSKLQQNPLKASHVIALCMKKTANKNIPEVEDVAAVACAVQNIYLSVTAYGLGGYWTTGGVTYKEKAKEFFGLGEEDKLLGFFYIGHIAIPTTGATRKPLDEKVKWVN